MKLEYMLGGQLRKAIQDQLPVLIPAGVIEYHGEHLGLGCDTLIALKVAELLEKEIPLVLAPPFHYGTASYAVEGPEYGTINVDNERLGPHLKDVLRGILEVGFRRIIVLIHHQYEDGVELPFTLAFKKAAMELIFHDLEVRRGRGWWGDEKNLLFYSQLETETCPYNWIRVLPVMHPEVQKQTGYDHAGKHESSLLWALCPEAVDMNKRGENHKWYTKSAAEATLVYGQRTVQLIIEQLRTELR